MDQQQREGHPVAYPPVPKCIIKEEATTGKDQGECSEHRKGMTAYYPLPHGAIKEESSSGEVNSGIQQEGSKTNDVPTTSTFAELPTQESDHLRGLQSTGITPTISCTQIKEEPLSDDGSEDEDECELVAYSPLPPGVIKEEDDESQLKDGYDETLSEMQKKINNSATKNLAGDAGSVVPFVVSSASDGKDGMKPHRAKKQKRTPKSKALTVGRTSNAGFDRLESQPPTGVMPNTSRALRSRSKRISNLMASDGVKSRGPMGTQQLEESNTVRKGAEFDGKSETNEKSSLENVGYSDDDSSGGGLVSSHSARPSSASSKEFTRKSKPQKNEEGNGKPFKCMNCERSFKLNDYLKQHLRRVCGVDPQFSCKECGNLFKTKRVLQLHLMKIHKVEKSHLAQFGAGPKIRPTLPFKCDKCGKTYKLKRGLAQHLKYECGVQPAFPCTQCDYRAALKADLRKHLMSVHNVNRSQFSEFGAAAPIVRPIQPFKCEKCGQYYKTKNSLSKHLKFECGVDRSFLCTQCDFRASLKGNLKSHIINVHAGVGLSQLEV